MLWYCDVHIPATRRRARRRVALPAPNSTGTSVAASTGAPFFLMPGSVVAMKGLRSQKWCSDTVTGIFCNKGTIGATEKFSVVKNTKGWVSLKSHKTNKYCTDTGDNIICNSTSMGAHQRFLEVNLGPEWESLGYFSLKGSKLANKWCTDEKTGMKCYITKALGYEKFGIKVIKPAPAFNYEINR